MRIQQVEQFSLEKAKEMAIGDPDKIDENSVLYVTNEYWGSEFKVGTMEDWEKVVPADEAEARGTFAYCWYTADDRYDRGEITWTEYRDELLWYYLDQVEIIK